jgi:hypothetical protein
LDLLGFIRPNPDFSMGCGEKNKKIPLSLLLAAGRSRKARVRSGEWERYNADSRKEITRLVRSRPGSDDAV